jgi:hypothetical protein
MKVTVYGDKFNWNITVIILKILNPSKQCR